MAVVWNVQISGVSVSGDLDTSQTPLIVELGNSDKIGSVKFALQNKDKNYTNQIASGNALYQIDAVLNRVTVQTFRGTLEKAENKIDANRGSVTEFTGYDYGQELFGLISPDARQKSALNSDGSISLTSGEQGMGSFDGMDLVLYVSGVVGSGTTGYSGGATGGTPQTTLSAFMSQYFGRSGDNTGSNSGTLFSFKPYLSGMTVTGTNPAYRTFYVQDGVSDTNANYWIPYDTLQVRHEYAWDVLRKLTRQGYVIDRSGFKVQFEAFIDSSGGINLITSGTSNFLSSGLLVYYQAGQSGAANNNIVNMNAPTETTNLKDEVIGWFPVWTTYPLDNDTFSDLIAYSGGYWSGTFNGVGAGNITISGNAPAPNAPGFISLMATNTSGGTGVTTLVFTLWSGTILNVQKWNVSGGNGVTLNYSLRVSDNSIANNQNINKSVQLTDTSGNFFIKSGGPGLGSNWINIYTIHKSGWMALSDTIYKTDGAFNSGTGQDGGFANPSNSGDLSRIKSIAIGITDNGIGQADTFAVFVDNINFQFAYNYNPVVAFNSGAISVYGRRYEVFEFPYQYTDSGAAAVVLAELQSKMFSRQLGTFVVKDNPNQDISTQFNILPGQVFVVDAPSLGTGSGQLYYYWRATDVKHEWSTLAGFRTTIRAYPWFSGTTVLSGQNLVSYSLPFEIVPKLHNKWPVTPPYYMGPVRGIGK